MVGYPKILIDSLENRYKFNLKVMGPIAFHVGFYIFHDGNGVLFFDPNKYIYKILHIYCYVWFKTKTKRGYQIPFIIGVSSRSWHIRFLDNDSTQKYQSLIGYLKCYVYLGIFDICTHFMKICSFRSAPPQGHMERVKII